jgi:hypothetical protein
MVEKEGGLAADRYLNQRVWDKLGWGTQAGAPSKEGAQPVVAAAGMRPSLLNAPRPREGARA